MFGFALMSSVHGFSNLRTVIRQDLDKKSPLWIVHMVQRHLTSLTTYTKNEDNKKLTNVTGCYKERVVNLSELKEKLDLPDFFSPMWQVKKLGCFSMHFLNNELKKRISVSKVIMMFLRKKVLPNLKIPLLRFYAI